jgi:hypothetical protein
VHFTITSFSPPKPEQEFVVIFLVMLILSDNGSRNSCL